ncbi:hypothetical protein RBXJA2T_08815 [Rubrivivax benzoatilyticus JA2 = ATCC BAA-35]|nr:hypothetical protein RBXJA2T_08815 [Rubrivivax benzoatilyticus JA2 = ATCC BAA-35]
MSNSDSAPVAASDSQVARRPPYTVVMSSLQIGMITAVRAPRSIGACGRLSVSACGSPRSITQPPISAVTKPIATQAKSSVCSSACGHGVPSGVSDQAATANAATSASSSRRRAIAAASQGVSRGTAP